MANEAFYQSIEFAVNMHGTRAVTDFEANVTRLKAEIAAYQQLQTGTIGTVAAQKEIEKLAAELLKAGEAADAAKRVLAGLPASIASVSAASRSAARGMSQAFLEFSRGVEDFAVAGPLGALNNLPRIWGASRRR